MKIVFKLISKSYEVVSFMRVVVVVVVCCCSCLQLKNHVKMNPTILPSEGTTFEQRGKVELYLPLFNKDAVLKLHRKNHRK